MPKAIHRYHQDTAFYIPKYNQTPGLSDADQAIFKNLEQRFFHEGRVIISSYLDDSNICQIFYAIKFDCLLDINEQICPLFVLEFYKSVWITRDVDQTISTAFIIRNYEIVLPLHQFSQIMHVACERACMYTTEWSIASLPKSIDPNPVYLTPLDDPVIICDAIFNERPSPKRLTKKVLLTRLYRHVLTIQQCPTTDAHFLTNHVMAPLAEGRVKGSWLMGKGITLKLSLAEGRVKDQEQIDPIDNYTLDPLEYYDQLPPIPRGALEEFKQTKDPDTLLQRESGMAVPQ
ncbi:hypothetical protein Tco_0032168 [Tanacetum coccineum]